MNLENIIEQSYKLRLLYVEDSTDTREASIAIFEEFFENIIVAFDGEDGLNKFQNNEVDLIITDIKMPKLDGIGMISKIKEINPDIPILILSAYNEFEYFIDSIKIGIEGYLLKPIDLNQFEAILGKIIEKFRYQHLAKENLHLLNQYQNATDQTLIVSKTDLNGIITYANDKFCEVSHYTLGELIGQNHNIIRHPDTDSEIFKDLWYTIRDEKKAWQGVIKNLAKNGEIYYVQSTVLPILDSSGNILEYIALRTLITDIMNQRKQLSDVVHDAVEPMVVYIKIAYFDDMENIYGADLTTTIEENFASKLYDFMPKNCEFKKVFLLGNGEYAFVKDKVDCTIGEQKVIDQLLEFQRNINQTTFSLLDFDYELSVLISFAYGENVLENTKIGMKRLIESKQDFICANNLSAEEQINALKNIDIIKMVKKAIEGGKIISYFQPIIDNKTKKIAKYESLVRLIDGEGNIINPYFFLETSKKGKYYTQITSLVLASSFKVLTTIEADITINLSIIDIEKESIKQEIYTLLEKYKADAHRVVFELLEDEDVKDFSLIKDFIHHVKSFGVKIAIDDFGSGYSNFKRLLDYQPDIVKIDGSIIKDIVNDKFSYSVVKSIVTFAKEHNITVVGEFVENEEIYDVLTLLGVEYSQGYYFGKPDVL